MENVLVSRINQRLDEVVNEQKTLEESIRKLEAKIDTLLNEIQKP